MKRTFVSISLILAATLGAAQSPEVRAALDRISPDSMRGHLSFIASDLLEGRNTPSRGLDIAAEYIAAQFRRAGLEPVGDDGYFQTANWVTAEPDFTGFEMTIESGGKTVSVTPGQVALGALTKALKLPPTEVVKSDVASLDARVTGKVLVMKAPASNRARFEFIRKATPLAPALIVLVDDATPSNAPRLIDPESRAASGVPIVTVTLTAALSAVSISLNVAAPMEKPVKLHNVIGVLRGSDASLKDTYVMVTAHYDHVGMRAGAPGDNIYNGANDDGSGTVSVIEIAAALSAMKSRPARTIVFMTVFGEEKGLLGSRYYGRHPIFPIAKTVADVNLEQVGRTDSSEGTQLNNASMTGMDFSDVGEIFMKAGERTGVKVYKHAQNSDDYFGRSDNQALADQGVPAHTLCVAFEYPDYHGVADSYEKVDYANMAKVDRMVALGLWTIAENPDEPKWNEANPKTAAYVAAWKKSHGK